MLSTLHLLLLAAFSAPQACLSDALTSKFNVLVRVSKKVVFEGECVIEQQNDLWSNRARCALNLTPSPPTIAIALPYLLSVPHICFSIFHFFLSLLCLLWACGGVHTTDSQKFIKAGWL